MAGTPNTTALERGSRPPAHSHKSASMGSWIADLIEQSRPDIDPNEGFVKSVWSKVEDDYHKMADKLAAACKEELSNRSIPAAVESRVKSRGSIAKSLDRREVYRQARKEEPYRNIHEILQDLHDLVGIRIIVDYVDHIEATTTFVTTTFRKEKEPNVFSADRKVGHSWKTWFGAYECTNHHVSAEYEEHNPLSYYNGAIFEIQVTSLPANLYNKIAHPLLYKEEAGDLSQGDEIVIDLTKGLAFCYSLCTYYKRHKLDGKPVDTSDLELMQKASSSFEGPEFMSSIGELAGRIPGVDATEIKGKSIPRERLEMVLESLLNKQIQNDIGQYVADQLRQEIKDIGRPRIELHAFGRARFDSQDVFQSPVCQEGTQTGAISYIHKWIEEGKTPLLWICSHAGSGKSTLARTVARDLTTVGQMAAGYFFRRGDEGRNHIRHVIPTIAAQLVLTIPEYESYLRQSIDASKNMDFDSMLLYEQFKVLLKNPLSQVGASHTTKVLIIDALDECVDLPHVDQVLDLLVGLENLVSTRFRILVTSRDEDPVRAAILHHEHEKLLLATTYHDDNVSDIESILRVGFQRIRKEKKIEQTWPTEEQFREVVERSTSPFPLFIYATTLLRFLGDGPRLGFPKKRLRSWIKEGGGSTFTTQLDEMYRTVFANLDPDLGSGDSENLTEDEKATLQMILGAIALAAEPLSLNSLGAILGVDSDALELLKSCRAVIYIPDDNDEPVQMLHTSFSDFLLNKTPKGTCWFHVDEKEQHESLAAGCINHVEERLNSNICQLDDPAVMQVNIDPIIIHRYIPDSLQYACSYWIYHLQKAGNLDLVPGLIECFFYSQFLPWIECMAILGRLDRASSAMEELRANNQVYMNLPKTSCCWANHSGQSDDKLGRFLYDAYRFLLKHGPMIQKTPRQAYGSALLFSPTNSIVRNTFWDSRLTGCHDARNMSEDWDSVLQWIPSRPESISVEAMALSPNGRLLVFSYFNYDDDYDDDQTYNCFINLSHIGTGAHLSRTRIRSSALALCWKKDGESVIFVTEQRQVYMLDFRTEKVIATSAQLSSSKCRDPVAISPTGVVAMSHNFPPKKGEVTVWDSTEDITLQVWESMPKVSAIAISQDSRQVAVEANTRVKLLDIKSKSIFELNGVRSSTCLVFSSDGNRLYILGDKLLTIFCIHQESYITIDVQGIAFSGMALFPDEKAIALISNGDQLLIQSIEREYRPEPASSLEEDPNVSWNLLLDQSVQFEDSSCAKIIIMSPNGRYFASRHKRHLCLWRVRDGKLYKVLAPEDTWPYLPDWCYESAFYMSGDENFFDSVLSFSRDGSLLLAVFLDILFVWALEETDSSAIKLLPVTTIPRPVPRNGPHVIWMNGKRIAIADDQRVEIWDVGDGGHRLDTYEKTGEASIAAFAFAPRLELLAMASGSVVSVFFQREPAFRHNTTMPCEVTGLSFSPDESMLMISGLYDTPIWTAAVNLGSQSSCYQREFLSLPIEHALLESESIPNYLQFPYPSDANWIGEGLEEAFSTDGMFIKIRSRTFGEPWLKIQHASYMPPVSQSLSMICEIHVPESQIWVKRGSQRILQIPHGYSQPCIDRDGNHVAMIDSRGKIVLLDLK